MAYEYLNALKDILVYGGVSDADMEKGMVRCDVNVSVRPSGSKELGKKIEIKNMNSFSGARRALEYEIPRQIEVLTRGGQLSQETRRWDDAAGITETMRSKEMAHDYRYFPEPDLMPFEPTPRWLEEVSQRVVELPLAKKQRFMREYQLPASDAQTFVWDVPLGAYFESLARRCKNPKAAANWVINNLRAKLAETGTTLADLKFKPEYILELIELVESKKISSSIAQQVFAEMFASGEAPGAIVEKKGLGPSQRHRGHRSFLRSGHRRQSGAGGGLQGGQSGRAEFPQRPGHETEQRQSQPKPHRRHFGAEAEMRLACHLGPICLE